MPRIQSAMPPFLIVAALILFNLPAAAQIIDFETLPGGAATIDQQTISDQYAAYGVTFALLDRTTGQPVGSPNIAKAGAPQTAFEGCLGPDLPRAYLDVGTSFLTDGTSLGIQGDLQIAYAVPVAAAAGVVLDIDCRVNGGDPCEQWTITAYDSTGLELQTVVLDAPRGAPNPECQSPQAGPGDSEAAGWSIDVGTPDIKTIVLRYTGDATNVGLAFDNFTVAGGPAPLAVTATASADSVCVGETVALDLLVDGGLPPYTFQWEHRSGTDPWRGLGTGAAETVQLLIPSSYRVTVTDAAGATVTSNELDVYVTADDPRCAASLLVGSNVNSRVVRYSFLSLQPQVFVPSGSGGLSGTSKLVCGPDGNLYVSSQNNNRVLRYDGTTGAFMDIFVAAGSGGLSIPVGLVFGPDGNLYVASNSTDSILRYDGTTGAFIDTFTSGTAGLDGPTGLVFGPDGNLYVSSVNNSKVIRYDGATGAWIDDFIPAAGGGLDRPRGLVFGPDGDLYVGEELHDSVRRYDGTTGAFVDVFIPTGSGGLDRANDVAFGPDGVLYVASYNNDQVLRYDGTTGTFLGSLPNDPLNGPAWFAVGCRPAAATVPGSRLPDLGLEVGPSVPNPFNPRTTVSFTLAVPGPTRVSVIDLRGRVVARILDRTLDAGAHSVEWDGRLADGSAAPSGGYILRVESGGRSEATKMMLVR